MIAIYDYLVLFVFSFLSFFFQLFSVFCVFLWREKGETKECEYSRIWTKLGEAEEGEVEEPSL
jgi:hypothetical protein